MVMLPLYSSFHFNNVKSCSLPLTYLLTSEDYLLIVLQAVLRQYQRALSQWPADVLRPDVSFPKTMLTRTENHLGATNLSSADKKDIREGNDGTDTTAELEQVNALYSLLENRYSRKVSEAFCTTNPRLM